MFLIKTRCRNVKQNIYIYIYIYIYINCNLAAPWWPTLLRSQGGNQTNAMLITALYLIRPEGHWEPRNKVGSLSPAERLVGFETGTFRL